ncbi:hypothetical protein [Vibrio phage RYC]|nr:hypothetical protein [Vibrio phage RYC]
MKLDPNKDYTPEELMNLAIAEQVRIDKERCIPNLKPNTEFEAEVLRYTEKVVSEIKEGKICDSEEEAYYAFEFLFQAVYGEGFMDWYNDKVGS